MTACGEEEESTAWKGFFLYYFSFLFWGTHGLYGVIMVIINA
jgi:hypothetical protein